jgi:hypothetical protein
MRKRTWRWRAACARWRRWKKRWPRSARGRRPGQETAELAEPLHSGNELAALNAAVHDGGHPQLLGGFRLRKLLALPCLSNSSSERSYPAMGGGAAAPVWGDGATSGLPGHECGSSGWLSPATLLRLSERSECARGSLAEEEAM